MSFPTGLFVDAPEMQDVTMHALGEDVEAWPEELIQKLKERIPAVGPMSVLVKFMKKDEENGAATGSLVVSDSKKQAIIPVIAKDFMLYPFDVFIVDGKLLPLTPDYFEGAFLNNNVFQKLEEYPAYGGLGRFEDSNLWNATYPPSLGRYAYASAGYPVLDIISDTVSEKDVSGFRDFLSKNPPVSVMFHKTGQAEIIKKLASLRPVNMNEFRQGVDNLVRRDIHMLRKDGPNKYSLLSNADFVFSPAMTSLSRHDCYPTLKSKIKDCPEDLVNDVDQNGEKLIMQPELPGNDTVYIEGGDNPTIERAEEFGHFVVRKKNGVEVEGVVIPKVIDFDMELTELKAFLGKTMSTVQNDIAGVRLKNTHWELKGANPAVGQTGTFLHHLSDSRALCTVPVTIKSIEECGPELKIRAMDLLGKSLTIKLSDMELERIAKNDGAYILPKRKFKWVPMEGFDEVTNSPADFAVKTAAQKKTANPVTIATAGYGMFTVKGLDKYAEAAGWDKQNLQGYQLRFLLASLGCGSEKIAQICKQASESERVMVHGLKLRPLASEKIAAAVPTARKMVKVAENLRANLIKEASYVENSQTVDTLLALNFVNPENVSKFVGKIPAFKAAISSLASLLIASRIGVKEIPEQAVSTAMNRLIEVVNGLEALRATQEGAHA